MKSTSQFSQAIKNRPRFTELSRLLFSLLSAIVHECTTILKKKKVCLIKFEDKCYASDCFKIYFSLFILYVFVTNRRKILLKVHFCFNIGKF